MANSRRITETDRTAAAQSACEWVAAHLGAMQRIARTCHARECEVTGPAVDAIAVLIARGDDPAENVGLIVDAAARELRPRGPTCDPHTLETHGGALHPMDLDDAMLYDAPAVADSGAATRRIARTVRGLVDCGQNHSKKSHRAKAKAAAALAFGQTFFTGLDWRLPAANDNDPTLDPDDGVMA